MSEQRTCQNCKNSFTIEPEDFDFYKKIDVPPPTFCWRCRFQRRITYRNEWKIFRNIDGKTQKSILSLFSKRSGIIIYDDEEWRKDDWDAMDYGRDYDFSRPFFTQFHELALSVPHMSRSTASGNLRSDFVANSDYQKDSYLVFNSTHSENCAYANAADFCKDCFDVALAMNCERGYELLWSEKCFRTFFSVSCNECSEVWFSKDCKGCTNCFGCINLRNKQYYIFNKPYSKDEYFQKLNEFSLDTWIGLGKAKQQVYSFWLENPVKYIQGTQNENVVGEYVSHSRDVYYGYLVRGAENLRYSQYQMGPGAKDCMDITVWGSPNEICYENTTCGYGISNSKFCVECWPENRNLEYCMFMKNSSDCFGCFGLKNKRFCIFNKQFEEREYSVLKDKIKEHMDKMPFLDERGLEYKYGEFFPIEHAPFGYNSSIVQEHFPLTKKEAVAKNYPWDDIERKEYETTTSADVLPDSIHDVNDSILNELIACANCKRAYRIIRSELAFLRTEGIPLSRFCLDCRLSGRLSNRNSFNLYHRQCMCEGQKQNAKSKMQNEYQNTAVHVHHPSSRCPNEFETSYAPDRPEIVYCESCYNKEVS